MMYGKPNLIHQLGWNLRRRLQLSPIQQLFRSLGSRGVPLKDLDALEMFGGDGGRHTLDYCRWVRSLDVWEVDAVYEGCLRKNLPQARIKITDSFRELETTTNSYGLVVIDNPAGLFGSPPPHQQYCEHFEVFTPALFRILRESAIIIVNVVPDPAAAFANPITADTTPEWRPIMSRRGAFYETPHPQLLPVEEMVATYKRLANAAGFDLRWHYSLRRTTRSNLYYLAMGLARQGSQLESFLATGMPIANAVVARTLASKAQCQER